MSGFIEARPRVGYYYSGKSKNKIINEQLRQYVVKDYMSQFNIFIYFLFLL